MEVIAVFIAKVYVQLKKDILDAQGKATKKALESLGFEGVEDVRIGKEIKILLDGGDISDVSEKVRQMCDKLLINPVMENYHFEITEVGK
jgi:phosphoribosylformylglycinamidine synthase PurS subunit